MGAELLKMVLDVDIKGMGDEDDVVQSVVGDLISLRQ